MSGKTSIFTGIVFLLISAALSSSLFAQQKVVKESEFEAKYKYDTPGIKIEGTLIERTVYGPPGYGETPAKDAKETILLLKLNHAISVEPTANATANGSVNLDPAKDVPEVQLIISRSRQINTKALLGRMIIATGVLNESITASQRTKVWMDVQALDTK